MADLKQQVGEIGYANKWIWHEDEEEQGRTVMVRPFPRDWSGEKRFAVVSSWIKWTDTKVNLPGQYTILADLHPEAVEVACTHASAAEELCKCVHQNFGDPMYLFDPYSNASIFRSKGKGKGKDKDKD